MCVREKPCLLAYHSQWIGSGVSVAFRLIALQLLFACRFILPSTGFEVLLDRV